jgi:hypothetical protein
MVVIRRNARDSENGNWSQRIHYREISLKRQEKIETCNVDSDSVDVLHLISVLIRATWVSMAFTVNSSTFFPDLEGTPAFQPVP